MEMVPICQSGPKKGSSGGWLIYHDVTPTSDNTILELITTMNRPWNRR